MAISIVKNSKIAELLIINKANLEIKNSIGDSALLAAVRAQNSQLAKLIIEKKSNINATDNENNSALHLAARLGNLELIDFLIENGINLNKINSLGKKADAVAKLSGFEDISFHIEKKRKELKILPFIAPMKETIGKLQEENKALNDKLNELTHLVQKLTNEVSLLKKQ